MGGKAVRSLLTLTVLERRTIQVEVEGDAKSFIGQDLDLLLKDLNNPIAEVEIIHEEPEEFERVLSIDEVEELDEVDGECGYCGLPNWDCKFDGDYDAHIEEEEELEEEEEDEEEGEDDDPNDEGGGY